MEKNDNELLLIEIGTRLPYGDLKAEYEGTVYDVEGVNCYDEVQLTGLNYTLPVYDVKLYLRPVSSMTEEEEEEFVAFTDTMFRFGKDEELCVLPLDAIDWLNAHHFDYRGLIEKGLAIDVTKNKNVYERFKKQ